MAHDPSPSLADWQQRLDIVVETMREMSQQTEPQAMVRAYGKRIGQLVKADRRLSLSRRGHHPPEFRITRSTTWTTEVNPWTNKEELPLLSGGILAELIYGDQPRLIADLHPAADDPAYPYLKDERSLMALPLFDQGVALNMVIVMDKQPNAFDPERLPDMLLSSNLFGRATSNLVLRQELQDAYHALDRELKAVGQIQRSLLPAALPQISTLELATHYQPAQRSGGDYFDFFPLPDGKWGILIADVSGHGTPAAVVMAITHCIAHTHPGPPMPPATVLHFINERMVTNYPQWPSTFVTGFYGVYDPHRRHLTYACAGHNAPRVRRCGSGDIVALDQAEGLPLGILSDANYTEAAIRLGVGDQLVLYTDGITEAHNPVGELFGAERLDAELAHCDQAPAGLLAAILRSVDAFADGRPADDDRTLIVGRVV